MRWIIHDYLECISENIWAVLSNPTCHNKLSLTLTHTRTRTVLCLQTFIPKKNQHEESSWVLEWSWGQIKYTPAWLSDTPHSVPEKSIFLTPRQSGDHVNRGAVFIFKELLLLSWQFMPTDEPQSSEGNLSLYVCYLIFLVQWAENNEILFCCCRFYYSLPQVVY